MDDQCGGFYSFFQIYGGRRGQDLLGIPMGGGGGTKEFWMLISKNCHLPNIISYGRCNL